jgi:molybdopterin-guanine dinucleotide biosynthesis protein A
MCKDGITLSVALFAGGQSRRMGAEKATLMLSGKTLWVRQLETLHALKPEKILISARIQPAWCPPEIEVVLDEPPSRGPLSGLVATLRKLQTTHLLILAVDLPFMTAAHLRSLWRLAEPGTGVVPQSRDCFEPLCAVYPGGAKVIAANQLAKEEFSLQALTENLLKQDRMRAYSVTDLERPLYRNVNTPEDLAHLV